MASSTANLDAFAAAKRIVVKIGSSLFVNAATGQLDRSWLEGLAADVAALHEAGKEVVIVSSGAVALGRRELGFDAQHAKLEDNQAAAAVGQILLAHAYKELLGSHGISVAQVLLTLGDSENRRRYLNAVRTLTTLINARVVPVINENDTVATAELRYGDNDRLAGCVAQMVSAECLVTLSDVDGLFSADPQTNAGAEHIAEVSQIDSKLMAMAGGPGSRHGSGGMRTKLEGARIAVDAGCRAVITNGHVDRPLSALVAGARATWFLPTSSPLAARKQWIAGSLKPRGQISVDDGAARALLQGRSLLPAGVTGVEGKFEKGDLVRVCAANGDELARGLIAWSQAEAAAIAGRQSDEITGILGYQGRNEMIHRDDLVLSKTDTKS